MAQNQKKTKYQKHNFLYFGGESEPPGLDIAGTAAFLEACGMGDNPLAQARRSEYASLHAEEDYDPHKEGAHYCDFCAAEITGVEYEVLDSGLERCLVCASTALRTGEQFSRLYESVRQNMEAFFGITLRAPVTVRMVSASKIAAMSGSRFAPTKGYDARVLGFARKDKNGFSLYIENGSPRIASVATMAHEMTHIWQYLNWDDKAIGKTYGPKNRLEVYEGMAKWVEIQYLYYINEIAYGRRQQIITMQRDDEYGRGFLKYLSKYPLSYSTKTAAATPFENSRRPL